MKTIKNKSTMILQYDNNDPRARVLALNLFPQLTFVTTGRGPTGEGRSLNLSSHNNSPALYKNYIHVIFAWLLKSLNGVDGRVSCNNKPMSLVTTLSSIYYFFVFSDIWPLQWLHRPRLHKPHCDCLQLFTKCPGLIWRVGRDKICFICRQILGSFFTHHYLLFARLGWEGERSEGPSIHFMRQMTPS